MNRNQDEGVSSFVQKVIWTVGAIALTCFIAGVFVGSAIGAEEDPKAAILKKLQADISLCINDYANSKCKEMEEHEKPTD